MADPDGVTLADRRRSSVAIGLAASALPISVGIGLSPGWGWSVALLFAAIMMALAVGVWQLEMRSSRRAAVFAMSAFVAASSLWLIVLVSG